MSMKNEIIVSNPSHSTINPITVRARRTHILNNFIFIFCGKECEQKQAEDEQRYGWKRGLIASVRRPCMPNCQSHCPNPDFDSLSIHYLSLLVSIFISVSIALGGVNQPVHQSTPTSPHSLNTISSSLFTIITLQ